MRQLQYKVLAAANAAIDQTSAVVNAENLFQISVQVVTSATSTGTLKIQFSNVLFFRSFLEKEIFSKVLSK